MGCDPVSLLRIYMACCLHSSDSFCFCWSSSSLFPRAFATIGVRATVGGNLMGDAALCAAYASATVPTFSPLSPRSSPTRANKALTSTPLSTNT
eukprot:scaffold3523_cov398-Prasinococcus_capsulatus_cf.AAC.4